MSSCIFVFIIIKLLMENYSKVRKIGQGTFGDVLLVSRKIDGQVTNSFFNIYLLALRNEACLV